MQNLRVASADLQTLKDLLGWSSTPEVGRPQAEGDNTVVGQCKKLMADVAPGDAATPTVEATLHRLGADLNVVRQERSDLKAETLRLNDRIVALQIRISKTGRLRTTRPARTPRKIATRPRRAKRTQSRKKKKNSTIARKRFRSFRRLSSSRGRRWPNSRRIARSKLTSCKRSTSISGRKKSGSKSRALKFPADRSNWSIWTRSSSGSTGARRTHFERGRPSASTSKSTRAWPAASQDIKGAIEVTRVGGDSVRTRPKRGLRGRRSKNRSFPATRSTRPSGEPASRRSSPSSG